MTNVLESVYNGEEWISVAEGATFGATAIVAILNEGIRFHYFTIHKDKLDTSSNKKKFILI